MSDEPREYAPQIGALVRFQKDAPADVRQEFGRTLLTIMDEIGVEPGDVLLVAAKGRYEENFRESLEEMERERDEALADKKEAVEERELLEREREDLDELIRDVDRGILTWEELKDRLGVAAVA